VGEGCASQHCWEKRGERGKMKSPAAPSSWLRVSMGSRTTLTKESTGGGARPMAANDVARSMPSVSRSFKSPDGRCSSFHHAVMTAPAQVMASLTSMLLGHRG